MLTSEKYDDRIEKLPPVLTVKRAAEVAGRSRRTIRAWVSAGHVKASRPFEGRGSALLYIDTASLLKLLRPE